MSERTGQREELPGFEETRQPDQKERSQPRSQRAEADGRPEWKRQKALEEGNYPLAHHLFLSEGLSGGKTQKIKNLSSFPSAAKGKATGLAGGGRHEVPAPHPRVPLVERLDVDEGHLPVGSGHDAVVLTADDEVDVVSQLPPAVTAKQGLLWSPEILGPRRAAPHEAGTPGGDVPVGHGGDLVLVHVVLHKWVWVGEVVPFLPLQK